MTRTDYYYDDAAPAANSLVPSVTAAVRDNRGRLLLIHRRDNDYWALPGGAMDLGESLTEAAIREVREEAGVSIEITGLVGFYTDPRHVMAYDDGEVRQEFSVCFHAFSTGGEPRKDDTETKAAEWIEPSILGDVTIHPAMRLRIDHALEPQRRPHLG